MEKIKMPRLKKLDLNNGLLIVDSLDFLAENKLHLPFLNFDKGNTIAYSGFSEALKREFKIPYLVRDLQTIVLDAKHLSYFLHCSPNSDIYRKYKNDSRVNALRNAIDEKYAKLPAQDLSSIREGAFAYYRAMDIYCKEGDFSDEDCIKLNASLNNPDKRSIVEFLFRSTNKKGRLK